MKGGEVAWRGMYRRMIPIDFLSALVFCTSDQLVLRLKWGPLGSDVYSKTCLIGET